MSPDRSPDTTSQAFFEQKYRRDADPWAFASSDYEQSRYAAIFQALSHKRYQRAFEPGCSIGILTQRLASICDWVEALEISPTAVDCARHRCQGLLNVNIVCGTLPQQIPDGSFDLVVLSEIGYYFDEALLATLTAELVCHLRSSGTLLAAHWLGTSNDHLLSGDCVHEILGALDGLALEHEERHTGFRLDRWERL